MSDEKKIEDMPLADLLSMGGSEPERVQERSDEPGSGIAKLAQMVASSSVADAKRPSLGPGAPPGAPPSGQTASVPPMGSAPPAGSVPPGGLAPPPGGSVPPAGSVPPPGGGSMPPGGSVPPGESAPAAGSMPPGMQPTEAMPAMGAGMQPTEAMPEMGAGMQPTEAMPAMGAGMQPTEAMPAMGATPGATPAPTAMGMGATPQDMLAESPIKKKNNIGIFIAFGALVVAAGVSAFILLGGDDRSEGADSAQLAALTNKLEQLKTAKQKLAEAEKEAKDVAAEAAATKVAAGEAAATADAEKAAAEGKAPAEEAEVESTPPTSPRKAGKKGRRPKASRKTSKAKTPTKAATPKKSSKKSSKKDDKPESELGALLDNDVASGKKAPTGALPKTPSRDDVKNSMRPVSSRAAKCAKYSKGTVKLKITVGSNGRVTSSSPVGGNAGATAGNCVAMIARTAKFPRFSNPSFTFNFPVKLK